MTTKNKVDNIIKDAREQIIRLLNSSQIEWEEFDGDDSKVISYFDVDIDGDSETTNVVLYQETDFG